MGEALRYQTVKASLVISNSNPHDRIVNLLLATIIRAAAWKRNIKMTCASIETLDQPGSEPLLCALRIDKDSRFLHADSKDSDQTGQIHRLIWVFDVRSCHFVGFVMRVLIDSYNLLLLTRLAELSIGRYMPITCLHKSLARPLIL